MKKHFKKFSQNCAPGGGSGAVYGLGLVGALVYYLQHATSLVSGLWGIFKALFWPAFFVYRVIELWQW